MTLKEIFTQLETEDLHNYLLEWFHKSSSNIQGKIATIHFLREIYLSAWINSNFGYKLAREFTLFLKSKKNYDPINITIEFCENKRDLWFCGKKALSSSHSKIVNIVRLEHIINSIGSNYFEMLDDDDHGKCLELNNLLKKKGEVLLGFRNFLFLTVLDDNLKNITHAKQACDYIGKDYKKKNFYLMISIENKNIPLFRPTIIEGGFNLPFRPECNQEGWGRTLTYSLLEPGAHETITQRNAYNIIIEKHLYPSDETLNPCFVQNYLDRELNTLNNSYYSGVYNELKMAWSKKSNWWKTNTGGY